VEPQEPTKEEPKKVEIPTEPVKQEEPVKEAEPKEVY